MHCKSIQHGHTVLVIKSAMMDLEGECSVIVLLRGSIRKVFEADVNLSRAVTPLSNHEVSSL